MVFFIYLTEEELEMAMAKYIERKREDFYEEWIEYLDEWE